MKKKVLYIGGFDLPDNNAAAQRVIANAKILRELQYEVSLVGLTHNMKGLKPFSFEDFECINLPYPRSLIEWVKMLTSIKQYLPFYTKETSIVIAYNHPAVALRKLLDYNKKHGIKTLSDCTEWYEPQGNLVFKMIKGWDVNQRMYEVHCELDGVIAISRFLNDFYEQKGVNTLLLPPLVDKKDTKWNGGESYDEDSAISLLYAGSPAGGKDRLDFVISALDAVASKGKDIKLEIIGITEQQYRDVYLAGDGKALPDFVRFSGRVPHEDVIRKLKQADFQIFIREDHLANKAGFPTKFAETISAGTLVLTNPSSNLEDYLVEGENGFKLNIDNEEMLIRSLMTPLSLTKEEIRAKKKKMDTGIFDYRHYIGKTRAFLEKLYDE